MHPSPRAETTRPWLPSVRCSIDPPHVRTVVARLRAGRPGILPGSSIRCFPQAKCCAGFLLACASNEGRDGERPIVRVPAAALPGRRLSVSGDERHGPRSLRPERPRNAQENDMNRQASPRPAGPVRPALRQAEEGRSGRRRLVAVPGNRSASRAASNGTARRRGTSSTAAGRDRRSPGRRSEAVRQEGRGETPKARGERTRRRVADALLGLLEEGGPPPTAKAVAERAHVSVRLVFHHFEDMDALYRLLARVQFERHWSSVRVIPAELPVAARIDRTVLERSKLFEKISPVRRSGFAVAARSEAVARAIERSDALLREWLETTFAPELRSAGRAKRELLAAIDAATCWEAWERLRRVSGLSSSSARRAMTLTLKAILDA